jgi:hypothetical protein
MDFIVQNLILTTVNIGCWVSLYVHDKFKEGGTYCSLNYTTSISISVHIYNNVQIILGI